ncbi:MAG TPA: DUF1501 domain-containing protein [Gammaproteobacteria bacterium]
MPTTSRREVLKGALAAGGALLAPRLTLAASPSDARFVLILLRGGLDGLSAVPPYADPDYARLRRELALPAPGTDGGALDLDGFFGLHPSLTFLHEAFADGELAVLHAVATPYRDRSHFDAQNVLESGFTTPHAGDSGWLNRALGALPAARAAAPAAERAVALGQNVPLVLRGPAQVTSWSPSRLPAPDDDTLRRIADLYAEDPLLSRRLDDALAARAQASASMDDRAAGGRRGDARLGETVAAAAGFLGDDGHASVAVLDTTGWDTHANEGAAQGQLALRLASLDAALRELKRGLGPSWRRTVVLVATEFGRTAEANGSRGTDHGTGAAAFLLGGAVQGGRVVADWPGLAARALHEGRDLAPTLDLRSVLKGVLAEHLGVPEHALDADVFPDSRAAPLLTGLVRA